MKYILDSEGKWHNLDIRYRNEVRELSRTLCPSCSLAREYEKEESAALD